MHNTGKAKVKIETKNHRIKSNNESSQKVLLYILPGFRTFTTSK